MQQVLNSQERNQAFLKFLIFFLVTIMLVITAVFFNFKMPSRQIKSLQSEVDVQRIQDDNQQRFVGMMQEASQLLDSMDKKGTNLAQVNLLLESKIRDMNAIGQSTSTIYGRMNKVIIYKLGELQAAKKSLIDAEAKTTKVPELQAQLDRLQTENVELQRSLDGYRKANGGL